MKLREKQKRFAEKYIELGNATQAAIEAGYSKKTAKETGYENLTKPHIKAYIDTRLAELDEKRVMKADEALELLTKIARGELSDSVVVSGGWGYEVINKPPDINQRKDAAKELLKRYPMNKMDELKERLLEAQITKTEAETKNEEAGTRTIIINDKDAMRRAMEDDS
ncbi:terminase small subunit [Paenalkalicoccus suaedae]|uniref:Terminase small subunit n=1 Tax=Paenalkalicoccus suaedae TaxID=2592382 RepID=A0A859FKE3_9BACI|nr:terminase small subunit [Paenalkalicoccus suaedae]QKS73270.1 terminase small subunit [Paenalkalicoccus suaedae]